MSAERVEAAARVRAWVERDRSIRRDVPDDMRLMISWSDDDITRADLALLADAVAPTVDRDTLVALLNRPEHAPMSDHVPDSTGAPECVSCPWPLYMLGPEEIADVLLTAMNSRPIT